MKRLLVGGTGGGQLIKSTPREGKRGALETLGQAVHRRNANVPNGEKDVWGGLSVRVSPVRTAGSDAARNGL
jgi:hypothetical protein